MFLWSVLALTGIKKERWTIFIRAHITIMRTRNRILVVDDTQTRVTWYSQILSSIYGAAMD